MRYAIAVAGLAASTTALTTITAIEEVTITSCAPTHTNCAYRPTDGYGAGGWNNWDPSNSKSTTTSAPANGGSWSAWDPAKSSSTTKSTPTNSGSWGPWDPSKSTTTKSTTAATGSWGPWDPSKSTKTTTKSSTTATGSWGPWDPSKPSTSTTASGSWGPWDPSKSTKTTTKSSTTASTGTWGPWDPSKPSTSTTTRPGKVTTTTAWGTWGPNDPSKPTTTTTASNWNGWGPGGNNGGNNGGNGGNGSNKTPDATTSCPAYTATAPPAWFTALPTDVLSSIASKWQGGPPADWCSYSFTNGVVVSTKTPDAASGKSTPAAATGTGATGSWSAWDPNATGVKGTTTGSGPIASYTGAAPVNAASYFMAGAAAVAAVVLA